MNQIMYSTNEPVRERAATATGRERTVLDLLTDAAAGYYKQVIAVLITAFALGVLYIGIAEPVYQTTALVKVDESPENSDNVLGVLSKIFDAKTATAPEMEVLRSRSVVAPVVDRLHLYIEATPRSASLFSDAITRLKGRMSDLGFNTSPFLSPAKLAGNIDVTQFDVPDMLEGKPFLLTPIGDGKEYTLSLSRGELVLKGSAGELLEASTPVGNIRLLVQRISASPGSQIKLVRVPRMKAVEQLQDSLKIAEKGKQSGVISVSLAGEDPVQITRILSEVGTEYMKHTELRKAQTAEKSLAFLDQQLPALKAALEASEKTYNEFRNQRGTIDLGEEAKSLLQMSALAQTKLMELHQKKVGMLATLTTEHPYVISVTDQMNAIKRDLADLNRKIKGLPDTEQAAVRLSRDVKVNTDVYTAVLSAAKQLRLVSGSKAASVRILDAAAVPAVPIKPKPVFVIASFAMGGLFVGVGIALVRMTKFGKIDDKRDIERHIAFPVTASIPYSTPAGAMIDDVDESFRRLRVSMQSAMRQARNNMVVISGPTPGVGKSFVSANLAVVLASFGKRVLLIDSDLRTGQLHRCFGVARWPGLAEAIRGQVSAANVVKRNLQQNFDFIPTGKLPTKPAELLADENCERVLRQLSGHYDVVIIDTAPVLTVADTLTLAPLAGMTFNVVRSGDTSVEEIEEVNQQFSQVGVTPAGIILNGLRARRQRYAYSSAYPSLAGWRR